MRMRLQSGNGFSYRSWNNTVDGKEKGQKNRGKVFLQRSMIDSDETSMLIGLNIRTIRQIRGTQR